MSEGFESHEVPGVGEVLSRRGTSTSSLAGAAHYWSKKYATARKDGWRDGFISACVTIALAAMVAASVLHYL